MIPFDTKMFVTLLAFAAVLWWLNKRGKERAVGTEPRATNDVPQTTDMPPSQPRTVNEMVQLVKGQLMESTVA